MGTPAYAAETVAHPELNDAHLRNPGMGFIYPAPQEPMPEIADVFYIWINTWTDVEPEPGQFNWKLPQIVNVVEAARSTGRQAALRILPCFNETSKPLPKWLKDAGVRLFPRDDHANFEPEYWHPAYVEAYAKFVQACGEHFDGEPWLAWVDMRFYGFWGEGHRYGATVPWPEKVDKRALLIRYLDMYLHAFRKTPLAVEASTDKDTPFPGGTAVDYAVEHGCWMRRDGFGPFIAEQETRFFEQNWKRSVGIAENGCSYASFLDLKVTTYGKDPRPITLDEVFNQMFEHHINYFPLGWGKGDLDEVLKRRPDLVRKADLKMGYRFEISEARWPSAITPGHTLAIATSWKNSGTGRLPFRHAPAFYLLDQQGATIARCLDKTSDVTQWVSTNLYPVKVEMEIPPNAPKGTYALAAALEDPQGVPRIALAIKGDDGHRRFVLGQIVVGDNGAAPSSPGSQPLHH
jgi:hypothetical protein